MKALVRRYAPKPILDRYRRFKLEQQRRANGSLSVEQVFTGIYASNRWGGAKGEFCSGGGSTSEGVVAPYVDAIAAAARREGFEGLRFVDLGCGDFQVGQRLLPLCSHYTGADIVKRMVEHHQAEFGGPAVDFVHLNIVEQEPPPGDVCFVRQVLQHLSNAQIASVLPKLARYRWVFITEHYPTDNPQIRPNIDKAHGGDIRLSDNSGVYLTEPPFGLPAGRLSLVLDLPGTPAGAADPGRIRTYLYRPAQAD